jgi:hypothetical protein
MSMSSKTYRIIESLSADHAVEIRKLVLPDGKNCTESLMNDGTRRLTHSWRENGVTQFAVWDVTGSDWQHPEAEYLSIVRRNPRTGDWDAIR